MISTILICALAHFHQRTHMSQWSLLDYTCARYFTFIRVWADLPAWALLMSSYRAFPFCVSSFEADFKEHIAMTELSAWWRSADIEWKSHPNTIKTTVQPGNNHYLYHLLPWPQKSSFSWQSPYNQSADTVLQYSSRYVRMSYCWYLR